MVLPVMYRLCLTNTKKEMTCLGLESLENWSLKKLLMKSLKQLILQGYDNNA